MTVRRYKCPECGQITSGIDPERECERCLDALDAEAGRAERAELAARGISFEEAKRKDVKRGSR